MPVKKIKKTCCDCGCGRLPPCSSSKKKAGCACKGVNGGGCACKGVNGGCGCDSSNKLKILKKY